MAAAARLARVSQRTIRQWMRIGRLRSVLEGGRRLIDPADLVGLYRRDSLAPKVQRTEPAAVIHTDQAIAELRERASRREPLNQPGDPRPDLS